MTTNGIVFHNCSLFDGRATGQVVRDAVIVASSEDAGGRILALGARNEIVVPPSATLVDLGGRFVTPGLINMHCHLFSDGVPRNMVANERALRTAFWLVGRWPVRELFLRRVRGNLRNALHSGVTTMRCVGDPYFFDVLLRDEIERGRSKGPRLVVAGMGIGITGGHAALLSTQADSPWEVRRAVRYNLREGVDFLKIFSTGGAADSRHVGEAGRLQMTPLEIEAACDEAHRAGRFVASHAQSTRGVLEALTGGVDTIEHGAALDDECVELMLTNPRSLRGWSALVPTLSAVLHLAEAPTEQSKVSQTTRDNVRRIRDGVIAGFRRAVREGVRVGIGSDAAMPLVTHYDFWRELVYMSHYGELSPKDVLSLATVGNAEIMGIADDVGALAVGKSADLIAMDGDPTVDLSALARVDLVVSRGRIIRTPSVRRIAAVENSLAELRPSLLDAYVP